MPDRIREVVVRLRTGELITDRVMVRTTLLLEDVLGKLVKTKVRGIFRYSCERTFFEGEGVDANQITCVAGQHLGVINAKYSFYTFRSGEDSNLPGCDSAFASAICKRNSFLKYQCAGNAPDLRYGFYKDSAPPFVVGVSLTRAPEGDNLTGSYGYAALPDENGRCPLGLVKGRPWMAQPESILQGSLDGSNPPSSFINTNNSLANTVVETTEPEPFQVTRQPSLLPCDGTGDCASATFNGVSTAEMVRYSALTPVVCVIPPSLLTGIF